VGAGVGKPRRNAVQRAVRGPVLTRAPRPQPGKGQCPLTRAWFVRCAVEPQGFFTLTASLFYRVFSRRRERCQAREDDGSVHRTLSKSDRRLSTRSSLMSTL